MANADTDMQLLNEAERGRHLQKQKKRRLQGREDEVCCDFYLFILFALCFLIPTL
jgi:peptidyl-prolyl cis-trans isomerase SDCCAG10